MLLEDIAAQIPWTRLTGNPRSAITGIAFDSRKVKAGDLFVAVKGEHFDGMQFAESAAKLGAVAIAAETPLQTLPGVGCLHVPDARRFLAQISTLFFANPAGRLTIAAFTGTNGKTTSAFLMSAIFRNAGLKSCLVGTLGMSLGKSFLPSGHTTPEAPDLVRFLRQAADGGCTHASIEASSHSLCLKRLYGTKITAAVFTNLTPDHLDFHEDMESYFRAKQLLFLPEGNNRIEYAVINSDDSYGKRLIAEAGCPVVRFGFEPGADIQVLECNYRADGTDLRIASPAGEIRLVPRLVGRPNTYNIMAAIGAATCLGLDKKTIRAGIEDMPGVPGRMEPVDAGQPFSVYVDYAHTPDALRNLLETAARIPHRRIITVFGCGGDRDRFKRPIMGEIAAALSDMVIATSDNPRSEEPLDILRQIQQGLRKGPAEFHILPDRRSAITAGIGMANEGDIVLIAGKGHEDYQIIGARRLPFDDRQVARDVILGQAAGRGDSV